MKTNNNTSTKRLFAKIVCVRSFYIRKKMVATAIEMWTFSTFRKTLEKRYVFEPILIFNYSFCFKDGYQVFYIWIRA